MSYCRFGDGDVYMFPHVWGMIVCMGCKLAGPHESGLMILDKAFIGGEEALEHLQEHRNAGHKVPQDAFDRLRREIASGTWAQST